MSNWYEELKYELARTDPEELQEELQKKYIKIDEDKKTLSEQISFIQNKYNEQIRQLSEKRGSEEQPFRQKYARISKEWWNIRKRFGYLSEHIAKKRYKIVRRENLTLERLLTEPLEFENFSDLTFYSNTGKILDFGIISFTLGNEEEERKNANTPDWLAFLNLIKMDENWLERRDNQSGEWLIKVSKIYLAQYLYQMGLKIKTSYIGYFDSNAYMRPNTSLSKIFYDPKYSRLNHLTRNLGLI